MAKNKKTITFAAIVLIFVVLISVGVVLSAKLIGKIQRLEYPQKYSEFVLKYANEYAVDPFLVYALIKTESGFKPNAKSDVNAVGLMQITEETFAWIKMKNFSSEETVFEDLYDAETNIKYGTYLLSECLNRYGDVSTAAAAYHSGWGTVDSLLAEQNKEKSGNYLTLTTFPYTQMRHYVYKINKYYEKYQKIYSQNEGV